MDLRATLKTDGGRAPRLRKTDGGWQGSRVYWINTTDEELAHTAPGLPKEGEAWSAALPTLQCRSIDIQFIHGIDIPPTVSGQPPTGGTCEARLEYATPGLIRSSLPLVPKAGLKYTTIESNTSQVTLYASLPDPDFVGPPDPRPINNGQGCPREVSETLLRIVTYFRPSELNGSAIFGLLDLRQTLNRQPVSFPPLYGVGATLLAEPFEARYIRPVFAMQGEFLECIHEIALSRNARPEFIGHDYAWMPEDKDGNFTSDNPVISRRYPTKIWPTSPF